MLRPAKLCRRLTRGGVLTLPNLLSALRLPLIPLFLHLALGRDEPLAACGVLALSAATDVLDGFIARRFHMESELGRFLDPLADKLTQCALLLAAALRRSWLRHLLLLFIIKECLQLRFALRSLETTDRVESAHWYGKLCTVILEPSLAVLLLPSLPPLLPPLLTALSGTALLLSLALYVRLFTEKRPAGDKNR